MSGSAVSQFSVGDEIRERFSHTPKKVTVVVAKPDERGRIVVRAGGEYITTLAGHYEKEVTRHTVEFRLPRKGDRFLGSTAGDGSHEADRNWERESRWVIVD